MASSSSSRENAQLVPSNVHKANHLSWGDGIR